MLIALSLLACSEYALNVDVTPDGLPPGDDAPVDVVGDAATCTAAPASGFAVEMLGACAGEPQIGAFTPVLEWNWNTNAIHPGYEQVMSTPAVANLTDDDGDGDIDTNDIPDVVFTAFSGGSYGSPGALVAISGDDGRTLWSVMDVAGSLPYGASGVAIADLDGDGRPTILVSATTGLLAVDPTGALQWVAPVAVSAYGFPAAADIDGDGISEVIYGANVVNADGTVRWTGAGGNGGGGYSSFLSFAADLDRDGSQEIVAGRTVYRADGSILWDDGGTDGLPALADLDMNGTPEVIRVTGGRLRASDALTGALVFDVALADGTGGPPTAADFDGDGAPEIGVAGASFYQVFESDGSEKWRAPVSDYSSNVTGSSVFDFEGDGAAEVVYADEHTLWVYDGATGAVEMQYDAHSSGTLWEYPLIVDVNHDGSSEIVVGANDYAFAGTRGIYVISDADDSWAPARPVWNQAAYSITNVNDDATIPTSPESSWTSWNSFRAGNSESPVGLDEADLQVGAPEACDAECDASDRISVWVPIANGGANVALGFDVTLRAIVGDDRIELGRVTIDRLEAGDSASIGPFLVERAAFGEGLVANVDDNNAVLECDETNNRARTEVFACDAQ